MKRRVHFVVVGRVQGVGFRWSAQHEADRLGLVGWIRNLATGEVEGEVEGGAVEVDKFVAWCRRGPTGARVDEVRVTEHAVERQTGRFQIIMSDHG